MKLIKLIGLLTWIIFSSTAIAKSNLGDTKYKVVLLVNKLGYICANYPKNQCEYEKTSAAPLPWASTPWFNDTISSNGKEFVPLVKQPLAGYGVDLGPVGIEPQQIELITNAKWFKKYWVVRVAHGFNVLTEPPVKANSLTLTGRMN